MSSCHAEVYYFEGRITLCRSFTVSLRCDEPGWVLKLEESVLVILFIVCFLHRTKVGPFCHRGLLGLKSPTPRYPSNFPCVTGGGSTEQSERNRRGVWSSSGVASISSLTCLGFKWVGSL